MSNKKDPFLLKKLDNKYKKVFSDAEEFKYFVDQETARCLENNDYDTLKKIAKMIKDRIEENSIY